MNQSHPRLVPGSIRKRLHSWAPVLLLAVLAVLVALGGDEARVALRYERAALEQGEAWRLLTGHLAHLGWSHLWMNLAALALIRVLAGDALKRMDWIAGSFICALAIDAGLYAFSPVVSWYVGLSGVLHGLLAAAALVLLRVHPVLGAFLGGGLLIKLMLEQTAGPLAVSEATAGGRVIIDAHLYGAAAGAAYGSLLVTSRRRAPAPL